MTSGDLPPRREVEGQLADLLIPTPWTLVVAEDATRGALAHRICAVPGASRYFLGAIVARTGGSWPLLGLDAGASARDVAYALRQRFIADVGICVGARRTGRAPVAIWGPGEAYWQGAVAPEQEMSHDDLGDHALAALSRWLLAFRGASATLLRARP